MHADTSLYAAVDCDDLVIGSGAARLSAAVTVTVTAAWHGQRVIVVEKDKVPDYWTDFSRDPPRCLLPRPSL